MIKGKTESGFEYSMDEAVLDDFEVLELVGAVEESVTALPKLLAALFGDEQKKAYYDHLRDPETRRVSTQKILADVEKLFEDLGSANETKN